MKLKYIHFMSQFAAPYEGNFIASLKSLEKHLNNETIIYMFPQKAASQPWMLKFQKNRQVYFTVDDVRSNASFIQVKKIFEKFPPKLIHTHFDGFNLIAMRASSPYNCPIIWHFHNVWSFVPHILKMICQHWFYVKYFSIYPTKQVYIISVCEEMRKFACKFGFPSKRTITIPNGIDISRFKLPAPRPINRDPFVFLAFGGRNIQKRIDLICEAVKRLDSELPFEVRITQGTDTEEVINGGYHNIQKIKVIQQKENVQQLYANAHCFISSSVHETFSYAVAEASLCGCAIIQSDISGTAWNKNGEATWVFPSENVKRLSDCMMKVMKENESTLTKHQQQASEFILKNYSIETWASNITSFYKRINVI